MPTFVIREKFFGYNDEVFYVAGNRIANIFQDQALAEQHYKQLEVAAARNFALYEVAAFFDATEDELQKYDDFVFSRCGEHIVEAGDISEDVLPASLNDADTFEFVQLAQMQSYQLVSFADEVKFYALWSLKQQDWIKEYDECFAGLIYAASPEYLKPYMEHVFSEFDEPNIVLQGTLDSLTENPILMQSLIATHAGLSYSQDQLRIQAWDDDALFAINTMLKQPLFEIREIALDEIQSIEKELEKEYGYDYE